MYLKINGSSKKYNVTLQPFISQHGYNGVKFVGDEIPSTDKGFKYYDDEDNVKADLSDYKYEYRQNEYTTVEDIMVVPDQPEPTPIQPSAFDRLSARVSQLSNNVAEITPFKESKVAYYGEKEKRFYGVPSGVVTVFFDKYDGEYTVSRNEDILTVAFPALEKETNITIMVQ